MNTIPIKTADHRGIIGLFRATCDAIETAIANPDAAAAMAFNGHSWTGGLINEVREVDLPVVIVRRGEPPLPILQIGFDDVLSENEIGEITEHLNYHAESHGWQINVLY